MLSLNDNPPLTLSSLDEGESLGGGETFRIAVEGEAVSDAAESAAAFAGL